MICRAASGCITVGSILLEGAKFLKAFFDYRQANSFMMDMVINSGLYCGMHLI